MWIPSILFARYATEGARCRRCGERIASGEVVLAARSATPRAVDPRGASRSYDVLCAIDVAAAAAQRAIAASRGAFSNRAELVALARARRTGITAGLEPVEPARDRAGRPRVSVLLLCSAATSVAAINDGAPLLDAEHALVDATLVSPLREYVLRVHEKRRDLAPVAAQPTVGTLYWQRTDAALSHSNRDKLVQWRALDLRAPVLALVGPGADDPAVRDPFVDKLRGLLARSGFDADSAPVVASPIVDAAMLDALALALDEHLPVSSPATRDERPEEQAIALLEQLAAAENTEALAAAVRAVTRFHRYVDEPRRQRIGDAVLACATTASAVEIAIDCLAKLNFPVAQLERERLAIAARLVLDARSRKSATLARIARLFKLGTGDEAPLLRLLSERAKSDNRAQCAAAIYTLEQCGTPSARDALRAIADDASLRDERAWIGARINRGDASSR